MEQVVNIPIQMISVCSTVGELTPLRFRFETKEHTLETVLVNTVLTHKETAFNGIKEIQYTCEAIIEGVNRLFILKYNVLSHKWLMFRILN